MLRKNSKGVADFARHLTPSHLYKSAKKASKQSYNTIISSLDQIYFFHFRGGGQKFCTKILGGSESLPKNSGGGSQILRGPKRGINPTPPPSRSY